jgi:hypothetical protein
MPNYRRLSLAFIFTLLLGLAAPAVVAQEKSASWTTLEDHWYVLEIAGARAGHSHRLVQTDGDRYRTASDVQMKISRGGFDIEITMGSSFIETKDGRPIMFQSVQKAATMSMKFAEDHVKQTTEQGGRVTTVQQPLPEGEWFTPRAADRYVKQHRQEGAETITYRTIDPNSGLRLMTLTLKRAGKETIEHAGKSVDVTTWRTTTDAMPGMETIEKIGPDGVPLYTEVPMPGMGKMVLRLTTREEVKGRGGAGSGAAHSDVRRARSAHQAADADGAVEAALEDERRNASRSAIGRGPARGDGGRSQVGGADNQHQ